ncbi:hypothetical protein HZB03_03195 [Candidatus Woesearchaeota archaeon]|nr:hypothetical protein [Candidatus Woesearchaeota archaeon]
MGNNHSLEDVLEGILFLHSETGTEGGYWAFQDSRYIQRNGPRGYCKNCGFYMKKRSGTLEIQRVTALDEEVMQEYERTGEINEKPNCANNNHEEVIADAWDYQGLHILENGDHLTIYHPDNNEEVWSGVINLKQHDLFSEHASGWWIHADQKGIERAVWAEYFFKEYSAKLIPSNKHKY